MHDLPADDVELAEWLLAQWDEGRGTAKSQLERIAWDDESSHGRRYDRFIRQVLGVETSMPSKQSDRIAQLADQVRSLGGRPRGIEPAAWESQLQRARAAGRAALAAWNDHHVDSRFESFAPAMVRAWSALSIAVLQERSASWEEATSGTGDATSGETELLVAAAFPDEANTGLRANVSFWVRLLDVVGHERLPALDAIVAPQAQAGLLNFERHVVATFGQHYGFGDALAVPLHLNGFRDQSTFATPKALIRTLPGAVQEGLAQFDTQALLADPTFAFRLAVVPIAAAPAASFDATVYYAQPGSMAPELAQAVDQHLTVRKVVRPPRPNLSAKDVVQRVGERIPYRFTMNGHTEATYRLKVRSRRGDNAPDAVDSDYCEWVSSVKRHLFNDAWVERLVVMLSTEAGYERAVGRAPQPASVSED